VERPSYSAELMKDYASMLVKTANTDILITYLLEVLFCLVLHCRKMPSLYSCCSTSESVVSPAVFRCSWTVAVVCVCEVWGSSGTGWWCECWAGAWRTSSCGWWARAACGRQDRKEKLLQWTCMHALIMWSVAMFRYYSVCRHFLSGIHRAVYTDG